MSTERLMYAPDAYAAADPASIARRYPFAQFITITERGPLATAIPLFFETEGDETSMIGHMARVNVQAQSLAAGQRALAIFAGPHAYISSAWYVERLTVPTWNYISAHVHGTIEPIDDDAEQLRILERTALLMESGSEKPWTLDQAPAGRVELLLPRIRSVRLKIERMEGVTKLSQTHPPGDRVRVIAQLLERNDEGSHEIARWMARLGISQ